MEKYLAICIEENKVLGKPQPTEALAWAIANKHSAEHLNHETDVRTVVAGLNLEIALAHRSLEVGSVGEILAGPFGKNEIFHVHFDQDDSGIKFRKVPSAKLK